MYKKSQAGMEFLMTYGWAILVVIIAIIALAYFGVFSLNGSLSERCLTAPGIKCLAHKAQATKVTLDLQNTQNQAINIKKIELTDEKNCNPALFNTILKNKESSEFVVECSLIEDNMLTSNLKITYDEIDGSADLINSGTFNTRVK